MTKAEWDDFSSIAEACELINEEGAISRVKVEKYLEDIKNIRSLVEKYFAFIDNQPIKRGTVVFNKSRGEMLVKSLLLGTDKSSLKVKGYIVLDCDGEEIEFKPDQVMKSNQSTKILYEKGV